MVRVIVIMVPMFVYVTKGWKTGQFKIMSGPEEVHNLLYQ